MTSYFLHIWIIITIYLILAVSLQLSIGFAGLMNFWHIAFFAIGAYTSTILTKMWLPFELAFLSAWIFGMIWWILLSLPTKKLKGDYLALATLWFTFVVYALAINWKELTGWALGIAGISKPNIFWYQITNNTEFFIFSLLICIISLLFIYRVINSKYGRAIEGMRDKELAMQTLGKNTQRIKLTVLWVSWFFAWIAWSLYAHYISYIDPSSFTLSQFIPILSIVIVAGLGSYRWTIIAWIILLLLPEVFRFVGFPSSLIWPMRQLLYAISLIIIVLWRPKGLRGKLVME